MKHWSFCCFIESATRKTPPTGPGHPPVVPESRTRRR